MNKFELAWAAGFFDGEGSTCVYSGNSTPHPNLRVTIGQTDTEVLTRFKNAVGFGNITGPFKGKNDKTNRKPVYQYSVGSIRAISVMNLLIPFLASIKKEQFYIALGKTLRYNFLPKQGFSLARCKQRKV